MAGKDSQPRKHILPISVTWLGMDMEVKALQPRYLETFDCLLFAVYTVEKRIGICLKGCGW